MSGYVGFLFVLSFNHMLVRPVGSPSSSRMMNN